MPKISVITINLNNKNGLEKTVLSVLNQLFTDYEYIIIDGGSTDGSVDFLNHYSDRITFWISEPDRGIYHALNKGIEKSSGEYCLFLNSGDFLVSSDSLKKILKSGIDEDIVYWDFIWIENNRKKSKIRLPNVLSAGFFFRKNISHQACLIKRNLFERFGKYDENYKIVSDWLFFIKTIVFGRVTYRHLKMYLTYYDGSGISSINTQLSLKEREIVINQVFPDWLKYDFELLQKYDTIVWMIQKSEFHPLVMFVFKSVNKILSYFWP